MIRVIQWATGGVGRAAIEGILDHPELELAGAWVHSADKDGMDLGELVGRPPIGVRASTDADRLLATQADCVLYSPFLADAETVRAILRSGKNVVTPLGWFHPRRAERQRYDELCRAAGVTLHGTGIHPGGITEKIPLVVSALSGAITAVRAEEFSDIRTYGAPEVVRDWMLFGATPEQAATSVMANVLAGGYGQCVNSIPYVVAAEPGVRTYLELPLVAGRAAAWLRDADADRASPVETDPDAGSHVSSRR
ncbi:hypothetical protein [Nocardia araoensis]|uniref:hypothetical protein n=1 Tax=Nocardia araoensis TaxID=228600 RepID=UPI00031BA8F7